MISYLLIGRAPESIACGDQSYLSYLVRFGVSSVALKIQQFLYTVLSENVMTATNAFTEAKRDKQLANVVKVDICISARKQNLANQLIRSRHSTSSAAGSFQTECPAQSQDNAPPV